MSVVRTIISVILAVLAPMAIAQETQTLKSAVVALAAQPDLRAEFEEGLVAKARRSNRSGNLFRRRSIPVYNCSRDSLATLAIRRDCLLCISRST